MSGCESLGTAYRVGRAGLIIEVARIVGKDIRNEERSRTHLELAREWVG